MKKKISHKEIMNKHIADDALAFKNINDALNRIENTLAPIARVFEENKITSMAFDHKAKRIFFYAGGGLTIFALLGIIRKILSI